MPDRTAALLMGGVDGIWDIGLAVLLRQEGRTMAERSGFRKAGPVNGE